MSTEPLPAVGSRFGPYRIDAELGRGGMGVVYRAHDPRLRRNVALKLLSDELGRDVRFRERFLRESQLAAATEHAGIVPVYDAGEIDGRLFIAMRYVDGRDLATTLREDGALDPERAVRLAAQLAEALDAAHAHGLIHRDVKPSNVLVAREQAGEHVYLADFGITEHAAEGERLTDTGQVVGTIAYLAPERIRGDPVDGRADVYSLACVLFECLTGEVPFARSSEPAVIYAHLEDDPPAPSERRPGLPQALDAVVVRGLAKEPERRWQTGAELSSAALAALSGTPPRGLAGGRRGPRRAVAVVAILVALAVVGALLLAGRSGESTALALGENAVGAIDPSDGGLSARYAVGRGPAALAGGGGSIWVVNALDDSVSRIDRRSGQVAAIPVGHDPAGIAFGGGSAWVTERESGAVAQISPETNRVLRTFPVANGPAGIATGFGRVWVASEVDRTVTPIDLRSGTVTGKIDVGSNPTAVATGEGAVWVTSAEGGTVFRIDPGSGAVASPIHVGHGPGAVAVGAGAVWVANRQDRTVSRIDPGAGAVTATMGVGRDPAAIAAAAGAVWVANDADGTLSRIDPAKRRVVDTIAVGASPTAVVADAGAIWTAAVASPESHRGGTLRVESPGFEYPRPDAVNYGDLEHDQVLGLAYDGLVGYRRAGGATYGALVGDLATGVPEPSPDGRTYVFTLRRGLRYSNGAPVLARDVRASLERTLSRDEGVWVGIYARIYGVSRCRPAACDLSRGVVTDERARTITIHLTEPDPDLLHKLALAGAFVVPAEHPFGGPTPPPGTGPYRIVTFDARRGARLVRNRNFRVRSRDARPDGFADEIVLRGGRSISAQVAAVQRGDADLVIVAQPFTPVVAISRLPALTARNAGRLFTDAEPELDYLFLNARTPPFDDVSVRRALNFAVDRRVVGELAGGADLAQSTCQILPPGFPGYLPSCRYTADPSRGGGWSAPDMRRARRLVTRSGTRGIRVTVWSNVQKQGLARYFVGLLDDLGYRSSLRLFPDYNAYRSRVALERTRAQAGIDGWSADHGAASTFAPPFSCDELNPGRFCDRSIQAAFERAARARGSDAEAQWRAAYGRVEAAAAVVPLVNRRSMALVSKRVGNYQHHPQWGTLLDQLWVR